MKIYTLTDPETSEIRYIGITKNSLNKRLSSHIYDCKVKKPTYKINWIQSLLSKNLLPIIELLEEVENSIIFEMEIYWIAQFKAWGFNLTNSTEGGEVPITKFGNENPNYGNKYNSKHKTLRGNVLQLDYKGNIVEEYICVQQTELNGFCPSNVNLCVHNKRTQHKGFQFIYKNEYEKDKNYRFIPKRTQRQPVEQLDKNTKQVLSEFNSAGEAELYIYGKRNDCVGRVCRGERKTYKGFIWRFKNRY